MFQQIAGRFLLPNLERDLSRAISRQLQQVHNMADCMIAPTVHAFEARAATSSLGAATAKHAQRVVKVEYPLPAGRGLFQG